MKRKPNIIHTAGALPPGFDPTILHADTILALEEAARRYVTATSAPSLDALTKAIMNRLDSFSKETLTHYLPLCRKVGSKCDPGTTERHRHKLVRAIAAVMDSAFRQALHNLSTLLPDVESEKPVESKPAPQWTL